MNRSEVIEINQKNVYTGHSRKGYGQSYFAKKDFKIGEIVCYGYGRVIDHQTAHCSVQIGMKKHYVPEKWTGRYWNHSCDPNTHPKTRPDGFPNLIAIKNIKKGEEITYSYWETEYTWSSGADEKYLKCKCGAKNCKGKIFSFSQLTSQERQTLVKKGLCVSYLRVLID